jgi:hypothetical protein
MFRSYRPGFWPWYLEASEARFLTYALEQTLDVAPRLKVDPALLDDIDDVSYLVRAPRKEAGGLVWEDRVEKVPPVEPDPIQLPMDIDVLEDVMRLPRSRHSLEIDFFTVLVRIEEKGERPYFPHMLLVVDSDSGMLLGNELLAPEPDLASVWGSIPVTLVHIFARTGIVPREIRVRSPLLFQLVRLLVEELGFEVKQTRDLPSLDPVKEFVLDRFV